jgi:hypothetical protein
MSADYFEQFPEFRKNQFFVFNQARDPLLQLQLPIHCWPLMPRVA